MAPRMSKSMLAAMSLGLLGLPGFLSEGGLDGVNLWRPAAGWRWNAPSKNRSSVAADRRAKQKRRNMKKHGRKSHG